MAFSNNNWNDLDCCTCLTEQSTKTRSGKVRYHSDVIQLQPCGHRLHINCISKWIRSGKTTCPTCRENIDNLDKILSLTDLTIYYLLYIL